MNVFQEYFSTYKSFEGFEKFHNEVINMPRDAFSQSDLKKVRTLASYLLLIADECSVEGKSYKYFLKSIKEKLDAGFKPIITDRNIEKRYFQYEDLDYHYGDKGEGRMFRHLMGLCSFFGLIESESRLKKTIVIDKCKEYVFSDEDSLLPVARNNLLILNAKEKGYIIIDATEVCVERG